MCNNIFFFSSRRRHTRSLCDWSSDVCSSDLKILRHFLVHLQCFGVFFFRKQSLCQPSQVAQFGRVSLRRLSVSRFGLGQLMCLRVGIAEQVDRKSTRLNSSHTVISYAVFCLKKKKDE